MIKYIIWDFDGVICDSKKCAFEIHNELCKKYKRLPLILNEYDYSKIMDKGYDEALSKYMTRHQIEEYFLQHRNAMLKKTSAFKVYKKVMDNIEKKKIPSIIITATYERIVKEVLENNGYKTNVFTHILGRETTGNKAEKLTKLCNELKIKKDEIIYVGDTLSDLSFCNVIGIKIICVGYGYCPASSFENNRNVYKLCYTQEDLIEYINEKIYNK